MSSRTAVCLKFLTITPHVAFCALLAREHRGSVRIAHVEMRREARPPEASLARNCKGVWIYSWTGAPRLVKSSLQPTEPLTLPLAEPCVGILCFAPVPGQLKVTCLGGKPEFLNELVRRHKTEA